MEANGLVLQQLLFFLGKDGKLHQEPADAVRHLRQGLNQDLGELEVVFFEGVGIDTGHGLDERGESH